MSSGRVQGLGRFHDIYLPETTLLARGYDETPVRKTVLVVGMLLGLAVFGATVTTNPVWAIVWISVALSGLAAASPVMSGSDEREVETELWSSH
jgi:hypothetical protein